MTAALTQTLYAPNPPQLDEPLLKAALIVIVVILAAAFAVGS